MFNGFTDDGLETYDTKEAALERARSLNAWNGEDARIFVQKQSVPLWFAHLVQGTWFEFLAYAEEK